MMGRSDLVARTHDMDATAFEDFLAGKDFEVAPLPAESTLLPSSGGVNHTPSNGVGP